MKTLYPRPFLSILFLLLLTICSTITRAQNCWQQGELITYSQTQWGTSQSDASNLLINEFGPLYFPIGGVLKVGIEGTEGQMISFTSGSSVAAYLPSSGPADILTNSGSNPTTTSSGIYGGEVTALHLNVDFIDGGVLQGTSNVLFGDLVLTDLTTLTLFNGLTVREILIEAENVLGGGSTTLTPSQMLLLVQDLNAAFQNGIPSQFAQDHLKRPWQQGDFGTYTQSNWETDGATLLAAHYYEVYTNIFGTLTIGDLNAYSVSFTSITAIANFLPQAGTPDVFNASLANPIATSAGALGGNTVALTLNVDFADAGFTDSSNYKFGDLIIYQLNSGDGLGSGTPLTQTQADAVNGKTVRQVLAEANTVLSGGAATFGLSLSQLSWLEAELNASFINGTPSQFAQDHLLNPNCNNCPVTNPIYIQSYQNEGLSIELEADDQDNDSLTYTVTQNAQHGNAGIETGNVAYYDPPAGFIGSDFFIYSVSDGVCLLEVKPWHCV